MVESGVNSQAIHAGERRYLGNRLHGASINDGYAWLLAVPFAHIEALGRFIHGQDAGLVLVTYGQAGQDTSVVSVQSQDLVASLGTEGHIEAIGEGIDGHVLERALQRDGSDRLQSAGRDNVEGCGTQAGQVEAVGGRVDGQQVYGSRRCQAGPPQYMVIAAIQNPQ